MPKIRCANELLDAAEARWHPERHAGALRRGREAVGHVECLCVQPPRRLVIRRRDDQAWLAVWPMDGPSHAPSCPFWRAPDAAVDDEGRISLRLNVGLPKASPPDPGSPRGKKAAGDTPRATPSADRRSTATASAPRGRSSSAAPLATLDKLLAILWEAGDQHRWGHGWTRSYWRVEWRLRQAIAGVELHGQPLGQVLFLAAPVRGTATFVERAEDMRSFLDTKIQENLPRLVLGELRAAEDLQDGWVRLALRYTPRKVVVPPAVWADALRRHPWLHDIAARTARIKARAMLLIAVESLSDEGNRLSAVSLGAQLTSDRYLPALDLAECALADDLVGSDRAFRKQPGRGARAWAAGYELLDTRPAMALQPSSTHRLAAEGPPAHSAPA